MLTTPSHLLAHPFGDWGEPDQPVVPQILVLAPPEDNSDVCSLPVLGTLSWSPYPFSYNWEWACNHISQLSWHHGCFLSHSMTLRMSNLFECSLTGSSSTKAVFLAPDWCKEGIANFSLFHVLWHPGPCPTQQQTHIFPSFPFAVDVLAEVLHVPQQMEF